MFKLVGKYSFPYRFEGKKDGKPCMIEGVSYNFEFYNPEFVNTVKVKVREEVYNKYDEYLNNPDTKFLFALSKDKTIYLKSVI